LTTVHCPSSDTRRFLNSFVINFAHGYLHRPRPSKYRFHQVFTTVSFQPSLPYDELIINGHEIAGAGRDRVSYILDIIRGMANIYDRAEVMTENNFPSGAGIASSASAFAALALAGSAAAGLNLSEAELSRLARRGSGSASRSIPGGFVEWQVGTTDEDSFAFSIAKPAEHWKLADCVAIVSASHKKTGSSGGTCGRADQSASSRACGRCPSTT
jgi:diphosphomevalonate decarboxylase